MVKGDLALDSGIGLHLFLGVNDGGLEAQHLVHTASADHRARHHDKEHEQHHEREDDLDAEGGERHDGRVIDGKGFHEMGPDSVDAEGRPVENDRHERVHELHDAGRVEVQVHEVVVGLLEFVVLVLLGVVGADDADPRDAFAGDLVQAVDDLLRDLEFRQDEEHHRGQGEDDDEHRDDRDPREFHGRRLDLADGPDGRDGGAEEHAEN